MSGAGEMGRLLEALKGAVYCIDHHFVDENVGGQPCDCDQAIAARAAIAPDSPAVLAVNAHQALLSAARGMIAALAGVGGDLDDAAESDVKWDKVGQAIRPLLNAIDKADPRKGGA